MLTVLLSYAPPVADNVVRPAAISLIEAVGRRILPLVVNMTSLLLRVSAEHTLCGC